MLISSKRDNTNPNLHRDDGATPLIIASQNEHAETVCFLLKVDTNPNFYTSNGVTPLFMASQEKHTDVVDLLLKNSANPNIHSDDGVMPLMVACFFSHPEVVQVLLVVKLTQIYFPTMVYLLLCLPVVVVAWSLLSYS